MEFVEGVKSLSFHTRFWEIKSVLIAHCIFTFFSVWTHFEHLRHEVFSTEVCKLGHAYRDDKNK